MLVSQFIAETCKGALLALVPQVRQLELFRKDLAQIIGGGFGFVTCAASFAGAAAGLIAIVADRLLADDITSPSCSSPVPPDAPPSPGGRTVGS